MKKIMLNLPAMLCVLTALVTVNSYAELLEYSFTAPNGEHRSLSPNTIYANPAGDIRFSLSAGIDRKVQIALVAADGAIINSATSHLLGAIDRITVDDKSYYGANLNLPTPPEGAYVFRAKILSADDSPVQVDDYPVTIDLTAPSLSDVLVKGEWNRALADGTLLRGPHRFSGIEVSVADVGVGVERVVAHSIDSSGQRHGDATTDLGNGIAQLLNWGAVFPNGEDEYTLNFVAIDKAGNTSTLSYDIAWDSVGSKATENPVPVAIYDPSNPAAGSYQVNGQTLSNYVPYTPNMTVYSDSYHVLFSIPKSNNYSNTLYGLNQGGWCSRNCILSTVVATDSTNVYKRSESDIFINHSPKTKQFNMYDWVMNSSGYHNVTVAPAASVTTSPVVTNVEFLRSDGIWVTSDRIVIGSENHYIRLRVTVESRPYNQVVWGTYLDSTIVPANQTQLEADIDVSFSDRGATWPSYWSKPEGKDDLASMRNTKSFYWDLNPPQIATVADLGDKKFYVHLREPDSFDGWGYTRWSISGNSSVAAIATGGEEIAIDRTRFERTSTHDWFLEYSYENLPEGDYNGIVITAVDAFGNSLRQEFTSSEFRRRVDKSSPLVSVTGVTEGAIQSLDDIVINLSDSNDPNPKIKSISLEGGAVGESVQLSWREESHGRFRLEYPVMFPSLNDGEGYTMVIEAADEQKNVTEEVVNFNYTPRQIVLAGGMNGVLSVPAVSYEFTHADGSNIIETEALTLNDGSVVTGVYDVIASLRSDAEVPLIVNGVLIQPGETMNIMSQHNFANSAGKLSIPLKPAAEGVVGSSSLLVMTAAPNSPVAVINVSTWEADATLSSSSWEIRQVVDTLNVQVMPAPSVPCRFTTNVLEARSSDPIQDPVCLLEWDQVPDESSPTTAANVVGLSGQAVQLGEQPIEYSVYLFNGDGTKVRVGRGSRNLNVVSALGAMSYTPGPEASQVNRVIEDLSIQLGQIVGPRCDLTLSADKAKNDEASRDQENPNRTCLLEWQNIPEGIYQDQRFEIPMLVGTIDTNGTYQLAWRVSIYSSQGTRVQVADESFSIEAVDPPAPEINLTSEYRFEDNIFLVPMSGDYLGDAVITAELSDLDISIDRDATVLESEVFHAGFGAESRVNRRINTDERDLWEETLYTVRAGYNKIPDITTDAVYRTIAMPEDNIRPILAMERNTAIDTEAMNVRVKIRDQYRPTGEYEASQMGVWKVRVVHQINPSEFEALTDWVDANDGEASFEVDISGVNSTSIRLSAEASLQSPIEGFERIERSSSPAFVTVLRGTEIDAHITTRRLSGAAPFVAAFKLNLEDRLDFRATGDVIWETSSDNGSTWTSFKPESQRKYSYVEQFDVGTYQVRAKVFNKNSGAEAYTEELEVIAYKTPEIDIEGATTLLVGSSQTYNAKLTLNDEEISSDTDDTVVEWSLDAGKTYTETGPTITLARDMPDQIRLWARVRDSSAPETDSYAYETSKTTVEFREVKAPRVKVIGPKVVETGKTYEFSATSSLPYKGLSADVEGFFTLPDGTVIEGDNMQYTPTEEDLTRVTLDVTYTAWIDGYRDQGSETDAYYKARVWQYVWPKFAISLRKTADVAPATVSASVRPVAFRGKLEDPSYEWVLPNGSTITDQRVDTARSFDITEPGEHRIVLVIRDGRGNEETLEQIIPIGQAVPYDIELKYSGSNKYNREPLDVLVRPYISGGHPRDRIEERVYAINGDSLSSTGTYGRATLEAGEHLVSLSVKSKMGKEVEESITISVAENQIPVCSIRSREGSTAWTVYAECEDTDGRVKKYDWLLNGELVSISTGRLTISKRSHDTMPEVELVGVDDAGGRSEPVTLQ